MAVSTLLRCIVDGKHVRIVPPPNSGPFYYNYKKTFSIVLFAIVNANYEFLLIDVGTNGRISDGGIIEKTHFYDKLKNNQLIIPKSEIVPGTSRNLNYVFIWDDAFTLRPDFMKPFSYRD